MNLSTSVFFLHECRELVSKQVVANNLLYIKTAGPCSQWIHRRISRIISVGVRKSRIRPARRFIYDVYSQESVAQRKNDDKLASAYFNNIRTTGDLNIQIIIQVKGVQPLNTKEARKDEDAS